MPNNSLGRGLSSLIPQKVKRTAVTAAGEAIVNVASQADKDKILNLPPEKISVNPSQPRRDFNEQRLNELVESIRIYGVIQPLIATRKGADYELIAGERRLRAAKVLGLAAVPVIIRRASEQEKLELALVENLQREDLNPIETALAYRKLLDEFNMTQNELAAKVGKSRPVITNTLRLLNLPEEIQAALINGRISEANARLLAGIESENQRQGLFEKILADKMTVSEAAKQARLLGGTKKARIKINYADKDKEFALRQFFGTKAEIKRKGRGGEIIIYFYSDEELAEIIGKIKS